MDIKKELKTTFIQLIVLKSVQKRIGNGYKLKKIHSDDSI